MTRFTPHYPIKRFCCWVIPIFLLQISSSWVKIRLPTENQVPRLPGSAIKVWFGGGGCGGVVGLGFDNLGESRFGRKITPRKIMA